MLKLNSDLVYYCLSQLVEIAIQSYKLDEGRFLMSVVTQGVCPTQKGCLFAETMAISWYCTMVCSSVEVISI